MLERIRNRVRPEPEPAVGKRARAARPRRVSRREREARQRRLLYIVTAVAGAVVVVALIAGASYQYIIYPRHALASVNGEKIQRSEYWKVREVQLRQNMAQLQSQLQFASGDQATQLQQQLGLAQAELSNVRDAPVSSETLGDMIDDVIIMQSLDDLGITISDDEIDAFLDEQFAPSPLIDPTATTTPNPTAAAWATATTESRAITATADTAASATAAVATSTAVSLTATAQVTPAETGTPATATPGTPSTTGTPDTTGTPATSPVATGTTTAEVTGTPDGTGTPSGTETPEGTPTATGTATPGKEQSLATSEALWELYEDNFLKPSDMSLGDYKRLVAEPTLARIKIQEQLLAQISDTADQVHAQHILVATEEAALEILRRLETEDFAAVAAEVSTDTASAPNGGDLGWFARGAMVAPFEDAAFSLEPGATSQPVQSQFGWHIIRVIEREANRPKTLTALTQEQQSSFQEWLDNARGNADISADIAIAALTPATSPQTQPTFAPPPDIPPTPVPSPTTIATPEESETPGATTTP